MTASPASTAYVQKLYSTILFRTGSASDVDSWATLLDSSLLTQAQEVTAFENSFEAVTFVEPLVRLYQAVFDRAPDQAGLQGWVTVLENGSWSFAQIAAFFTSSTEFTGKYGVTPNPTAYVTALYQNVLGRAPDADGLAGWVNALNKGTLSYSQVLTGFSNSQEFITTSTPAINTWLTTATAAAEAGSTSPYPTTIAGIIPTNPGLQLNLLTGIDHISITTPTTVDTVFGLIDQVAAGVTTFSAGDNIAGNSHTIVDLTVASLTGAGNAAAVTMSGVAKVIFEQGQTNTLTANAANWGSVNDIEVTGSAGDVTVNKLNISNGGFLKLGIATTANATLKADGVVSGLSYHATLESGGSKVGSVASFGTSGVTVALGANGLLKLDLNQSVSHTAAQGASAVGNISVGNIGVSLGTAAQLTRLQIENLARANAHDATVGNVAIGAVAYTLAASAVATLTVTNEASVSAGKGNALAGSITVGNITGAHAAGTGTTEFFIENEAFAQTGNATVGAVTVGNVNLASTQNFRLFVSDSAEVNVKGNATAGGISVGDITLTHAKGGAGSPSVELSLTAEVSGAGGGVAKVGNISVGNITVTNANNTVDVSGEGFAFVRNTGSATAGSVTVGNVALVATAGGSINVEFSNFATAGTGGKKGGAATVGDVTIGTISMAASSGNNFLELESEGNNRGTGTGAVTVGNIVAGDVTMSLAPAVTGGNNEIEITHEAVSNVGAATVGSVTLGNITINAGAVTLQSNASNSVYVYQSANAHSGTATVGSITIGNVTATTGVSGFIEVRARDEAFGTTADTTGLITIGNVTLTGGSQADMLISADNKAAGGTTGGITIGTVTVALTKGAGTGQIKLTETGATTGKIAVGNISMTAAGPAKMQVTASNVATDTAGTVTVGNVSLVGAKGTGEFLVKEKGATTGLVTVGNVAITAAKVGIHITDSASAGSTGGITVGNITWKGPAFAAGVEINQTAVAGNAGAITVGNISVSGVKAGAADAFTIQSSALNKVGAIALGDVTLAVANTNAGAAATVQLFVSANSVNGKAGNITTGNITIGTSGDTTKAALTAPNLNAFVTLSTTDGNVTIGNITVTGGVLETGGTKIVTDNLGDISNWLSVSAGGGTVTVGNIDYSGYAGGGKATTILDASGVTGAASIIGATAGSTITDNKGVNAIDVSHTTKADAIILVDSQTGVTDSGTAITAVQTALDSIIGIHTADTITLTGVTTHDGLNTATSGIGGTGAVTQAGAMNFATFLSNAETSINVTHDSIYSANVGGNTLVALNQNDHVVEIVQVTGIHTFAYSVATLNGLITFAT